MYHVCIGNYCLCRKATRFILESSPEKIGMVDRSSLLVTLGTNMGGIRCSNISPCALAFCQLLHHRGNLVDVHSDLLFTIPLPDRHTCGRINSYSKRNANLICPCVPPPNRNSCRATKIISKLIYYHVDCGTEIYMLYRGMFGRNFRTT
jgi:hypothetical protein